MIVKPSLIAGLAAAFMLSACRADQAPRISGDAVLATAAPLGEAAFSPARIRADVEFLAHDLLRGRETGSDGYLLAANYVAATYKRLGVEPLGENGSYFQSVPFATGRVDLDQSGLSVAVGDQEWEMTIVEDYLLFGSVRQPLARAAGELVFVGYGIDASAVGYSDLAGLDLKGRIAVLLPGAPETLGSEIRAHYRSSAAKAPALAAAGAVGMLVIDDRFWSGSMTAARRQELMARGQFSWVAPDQTPDETPVESGLAAAAVISPAAAARLFAGAAMSLDQVVAAKKQGRMRSFPLNARAVLAKKTVLSDRLTSPNVIGLIRGSDPTLRDDYVVLSAHLDHIGVNDQYAGADKIYNGAMDNATGTAILLEVARAYRMNGLRPRRSILLLSVTAEERGLLGADYFTHYPTVPVDKMVANVNLDMPVLLYDFVDVIAFGAEHSSLGPLTRTAAHKAGITVTPDPLPHENLFVRSDHYRFVLKGVPAVFLMTGFLETKDGVVGGEVFQSFLKTHYHQPSDQPDLPIDYDAGAKFAYVNFLIADEIANAERRPRWNEGDFFANRALSARAGVP